MADIEEFIRQAACQPIHPRVYEALMLAYYDFVFRLANSFLYDLSEAEDAAQETFIQAMRHIHTYQPGTNLKSWLAKITLNICRGKDRRQRSMRRLEQILQYFTFQTYTSTPTPEELCVQTERRQVILQAIDTLDEKHRLPVLLRYIHGLTASETAGVLGENEGAIYSRLHYANRKLRDQLKGLVEIALDQKAGQN